MFDWLLLLVGFGVYFVVSCWFLRLLGLLLCFLLCVLVCGIGFALWGVVGDWFVLVLVLLSVCLLCLWVDFVFNCVACWLVGGVVI